MALRGVLRGSHRTLTRVTCGAPARRAVARGGGTCEDARAAATGAAPTDTFLGERLRRLSRRIGGNRARTAVGRSILVIIWHLLASPEARFTDLGPGWHDRKTDRDKKIAGHLRQLRALGLEITLTQPQAAATA